MLKRQSVKTLGGSNPLGSAKVHTMSTQSETAEFILERLSPRDRFSVRAMFGEYALYADGKVVGLICNDLLYVKILPESRELESLCEQDTPYPGAKLYYVISEDQLVSLENLSDLLFTLAESLPLPKPKKKKIKKQHI